MGSAGPRHCACYRTTRNGAHARWDKAFNLYISAAGQRALARFVRATLLRHSGSLEPEELRRDRRARLRGRGAELSRRATFGRRLCRLPCVGLGRAEGWLRLCPLARQTTLVE